MKRGDILLIVIVVVGATFLSLGMSFSKKTQFDEIQVIQDGKVIERYAADPNFSKIVNITKGDHHNTIEIKNGEVRMTNANCPDQLCVHSHPISKNGEMIVCLPHRLYVKLIKVRDDSDVDIMVN